MNEVGNLNFYVFGDCIISACKVIYIKFDIYISVYIAER